MVWAKVDDGLFSHPKWIATPGAARGLWVTALSWCASKETDGFVPKHVLPILGATSGAARALVTSGMWEEVDGGWMFHDWEHYQPDAASQGARRAAKSAGGKEGNHKRWHVKRGVKVPDCEWCDSLSESEDRSDMRSEGRIGGESPSGRIGSESSRTRTRTKVPSESVREGFVTHEDEPPPLETVVPRHLIPADFAPGSEHKAYAGERGINLSHELRQFWLHCKSKRVTSLDWDAEFMKWLGNARTPHSGGSKSTTSNKVRDGIALAERLAAEEAEGGEVVPIRPQIEGA